LEGKANEELATQETRQLATRAVFLLRMFSKLLSAPTLPAAKQELNDCLQEMASALTTRHIRSTKKYKGSRIDNVVQSLCEDVMRGGPVAGLSVRLLWWITAYAMESERTTAIAAITDSPATVATLFGFLRHSHADCELESATLDLLCVVDTHPQRQQQQQQTGSVCLPHVRVLLRLLSRSCGHEQCAAASVRVRRITTLLSIAARTPRGYVKLKTVDAKSVLEACLAEQSLDSSTRIAVTKLLSKCKQWETVLAGSNVLQEI
jgi:hypothetical protein